jgi:hypothetical protein
VAKNNSNVNKGMGCIYSPSCRALSSPKFACTEFSEETRTQKKAVLL